MFDPIAVKKFLDDKGIKQAFIARQLNLSESMLSAILSGRVKCSLDTYVMLCQVLAVPLGAFIDIKKTA